MTGAKFTWKPSSLDALEALDTLEALRISIKDPDLCLRYDAVKIDGVKVGPSPWWLQKKLLLAGHKPINNIVDVTNYVLHEYGQPLHAFDAEKIEGEQIVVRRAKKGEKIVALDKETYELTGDMLVIADKKNPIAIAGVMGGMDTGTTVSTTSVIIESATFEPVSTRKTSRALNLQSDSSLVFEKGLSTEATGPAMARAIELILELAGGEVASGVYSHESKPYEPLKFSFNPTRAQALIGEDIAESEMLGILKRLGFLMSLKKGKNYEVTVPYWRDHDIENDVDFVEEVARVYGYDKVPSELPVGDLPVQSPDPVLFWERRVKEVLRGAGLLEAYNYAFVSEVQLRAYDIDPEDAVKLMNPLSTDHEYMRPSLMPSLLSTVSANDRQIGEAALFEIAPVYAPQKDDIPLHHMHLVMAVYEKDGYEAFRKAKGLLERLAKELGIRTLRLERKVTDPRWHAGRSAALWIGKHDHVGIIGEVAPATAEKFDIDARVSVIEVNFETLIQHATTAKSYHALPVFPAVKRDLAMVVDDRVEYERLEQEMKKASGLLREVELFDIYRGKGVEEGKKSLAMHLSFRDNDRTLEAEEVDGEMDALRKMLEKSFDGIMRS